MKIKLHKLISILIVFCMILCTVVPAAAAEPEAEAEGIQSDVSDVTQESLSFDVIYDQDVKCGSPTTFTIKAAGGSGNYKYYLNSIKLEENGRWYEVVDPGKLAGYQKSNQFEFTFYASGTYQIKYYVMDTIGYKTKNKTVTMIVSDPDYPTVQEKAKTIVDQCIAAGCKTDYEKALWLHDWILENCVYTMNDNPFTGVRTEAYQYCGAEGVLARGKGACEAYNSAYAVLLRQAGIECSGRYGDDPASRMTGNGHVWTAVKMDGEWYQIDTTWDDNGYTTLDNFQSHLYFGLTDEMMQAVHSEHKVHSGYESNSLKNNYFIRSGEISKWSDPIVKMIYEKLNEGETDFSIALTADICPEEYKGYIGMEGYNNIIYNLVAYDLSHREWNESAHKTINCTYRNKQLYVEVPHTKTEQAIVKATAGKDGKIRTLCAECGKELSSEMIHKVSNCRLSVTNYTYTGKPITPAVSVKDSKGNLIDSRHYSMAIPAGRKNVGTYSYKILFRGDTYEGTANLSFRIVPKGTSLSKLSKARNAFTVKWKKQATQTTGYQIQYSTNSKFKSGNKTVTISKAKTTSKKIKKLAKKRTYYVRVRTYKKIGRTTYYSGWSKTKSVKTK